MTTLAITSVDHTTSNTPASEGEGSGEAVKGIVAGIIEPSLSYTQKDGELYEFEFMVKNQTQEVQELEFTSSQRYDYAIKNEAGEVVRLLSSFSTYLQVMGEVTLKQGEELMYVEEISFEDLPTGNYTVEFWITDKDKSNIKDSVKIEVK
jgi:hypothetical protein